MIAVLLLLLSLSGSDGIIDDFAAPVLEMDSGFLFETIALVVMVVVVMMMDGRCVTRRTGYPGFSLPAQTVPLLLDPLLFFALAQSPRCFTALTLQRLCFAAAIKLFSSSAGEACLG